jgi:hypothetical protein
MFVTSQSSLGCLGKWSGASITYKYKFKYKFSKVSALAYLLHKATIGASITSVCRQGAGFLVQCRQIIIVKKIPIIK